MNKVVFLVLRRMRAPLVLLIVAYAISILGLVLIPGVDADGEPWRMDFFHAFYFVSYMATTIGFGELPMDFSPAQRMWTVVAIYLTVIAWLYAIGKILGLIQDPAFRQAVVEHGFTRGVRRLSEPFYIVCGYGDTGGLLVRALAQRGIRSVVVDINPERISELDLEDMGVYVPGLCADANYSVPLQEAGLKHPHCAGVIALTDDDQVNLKIAITSKLLNPPLQVICRAETHDAEANMASFGTDCTINPFDTFGERLALALHSPGVHLIHEWLTGVPETPLAEPLYPPHGTWILCGYGRFGKAVRRNLKTEAVETTIIEANPQTTGCENMCVVGRGTEAPTLKAARIEDAAGIVAGTDNDANNLSIIMTARELNPSLFAVARQNRVDNTAIFEAAELDLMMQRSHIIAREILAQVSAPYLPQFLAGIRDRDNEWANQQVSRISAVVGDMVPEVWSVALERGQAPALAEHLHGGGEMRLAQLGLDPRDREQSLNCLPLMLIRGSEQHLMPAGDWRLRPGDRLLYCGRVGARQRLDWILQNHNALRYVLTGHEYPDGWIWRWLARRAGRHA